MNVKGGIAYIDFKSTDITSTGALVVSGIYNYFNNAYKSRKAVVLRNLSISGEILSDIPVSAVRQTSNSEFVCFLRLPGITGASIGSKYITIGVDNTVTISSF